MINSTPLLRRGDLSLMQQGAMILAGTALIAVAAKISIPMWPVPMTLQTLAVLAVGLTFGSRMGTLTLLAYLAEGAMGLPVFATVAGPAALVGPTAGFLWGYILMAWIAGRAVEAGLARGPISTSVAALVASAALYLPGVAWPYAVASMFGIEAGWASTSAAALWSGWVAPFLIGDAVKAIIAALAVTGTARALRR